MLNSKWLDNVLRNTTRDSKWTDNILMSTTRDSKDSKWIDNVLRSTALAGALSLTASVSAQEAANGMEAQRPAGKTQRLPGRTAEAVDKPNIILLYTDDQGWGDLGCFQHPYIKTPNFDRLARQGTRFTNFYVNCPVCAPSRAAIMSGRFPAQVGFNWIPVSDPLACIRARKTCPYGLDTERFPPVTRLLKSSGYATGHTGKWHLGCGSMANLIQKLEEPRANSMWHMWKPENRTGETPYAFLTRKGRGIDLAGTFGIDFKYTDIFQGRLSKHLYVVDKKTGRMVYNNACICRETYSIFGTAREFIRANRAKPFYLNLWPFVPHQPLVPTAKELAVYDDLTVANVDYSRFPQPFRDYLMGEKNPSRRLKRLKTYMASITAMDSQLGLLLDQLKELGLDRKTLILSASDNGPEDMCAIKSDANPGAGSAGPFRARKRSIYEGGIRTPCIAWWPGRIPPGRVDDTSVISGVDWLATVCAVTGTPLPSGPELDGEDVSDILFGKTRVRRKPLYWRYLFKVTGDKRNQPPELAMRSGPWKFYCNRDGSGDELYHLSRDPGEVRNVVAENPDVAARLKRNTLAWDKSLPPLDSFEHLMPKFEKYVRKTIRDTFENTPLHARPRRCTVYTENKGDSIIVCKTPGRDGERCIKVTDAPGLKHVFTPHFVYKPSHYSGVTTVSFDLRLGPGAVFWHEWRQYPGKPYYFTGPVFHVRDGKLYLSNRTKDGLANLPENQWIHIEVACGNGDEAGPEWKLSVTSPGDQTKTFALPMGAPGQYRETTWIGFISNGTEKAEYWLDNIELRNSKTEAK